MLRLKGTTIIETIVAALIIFISFEMAVISITRILASHNVVKKVNAFFIAENHFENVLTSKNFIDKEIEQDEYIIKQKIEPYKHNTNIKILEIEILSANRNLLFKKRILITLND